MDEDQESRVIVVSLSRGRDPLSGERLPKSSFIHDPDVIRALGSAVRAMELIGAKRNARERMPAKAGKPWNEQEDRALLERFDAGQTIEQLAATHERTPAGIQARLERHGRVRGVAGFSLRGRAGVGTADEQPPNG